MLKKNYKSLLYAFILSSSIVFSLLLIFENAIIKNQLYSNHSKLLMIINFAFVSYCYIYAVIQDGISLRVIFYFYSLLFMCIAPVIILTFDIWRYSFDYINLEFILYILLIYNFSFAFGYFFSFGNNFKKNPFITTAMYINSKKLLLYSLIIFLLSLLAVSIYGLNFTSSLIRAMLGNSYSPFENILEFTIRPTIFFVAALNLYYYRIYYKNRILLFSLILNLVSVFLIVGPLSGARSVIFFMYFGAFLIIFNKSLFKRKMLLGISLFGGVLGSEIHNMIRDSAIGGGEGGGLVGINYFFQGHFDGFEMINHSINHINLNGIEWGWQILGALLFWVPRSVWGNKPIGTGDHIAINYLNQDGSSEFINFSMPLVSEFIINFHIPGIFIGCILLGYFCGCMDKSFKRYFLESKFNSHSSSSRLLWIYSSMLGILLFLLRGDLMSGISFLCGIFISINFAWRILHTKKGLTPRFV